MQGHSKFKAVRKIAALCAGLLFAAGAAQAASYPDKPIKLIVGFAPGGASDTLARLVAQQASTRLGQQIIVENQAGAGGSLAARTLARAEANGYTVMLGSPGSMIINPILQPKLAYDPRKFTPISPLARISYALMVRQNLEADSVAQLVELSKSTPHGLTVGSAGIGSNTHLVAMSFVVGTGAQLRHIPYKGTAPAMADLMAGNIDVLFDSVPVVLPQVQSGKIRILAVTGASRETLFPDVPTIADSGWPSFTANNWFGIFAPPDTPAPVVHKLNEAFTATLQDESVRANLESSGNRPAPGTPQDLAKLVETERRDYENTIKQTHISLQ
ncbi:extra-cytoplasmic solute receptor family protein 146 [Achromobacter xylosoxidans A8]|uniref:Extra-cytoplasmic solute receptor family protein 146 n=1 Tax=Achromobacter xylosoxidans (strain A8) TaxID=762376 RepID=E3HWD2_ACHXA|nr:tripartite tricarboxylate transporter substrate binding protein [Achromobacter xylosoxidans]ADP18745.1 extra-cytoplasmic solute receptor family protein 146 [Achromobacter xylosoxidans A8]